MDDLWGDADDDVLCEYELDLVPSSIEWCSDSNRAPTFSWQHPHLTGRSRLC